jgi:3-deoxy-D-manno-octulosonic-acid transferase
MTRVRRPASLWLYGLAAGVVSAGAPAWLRARARRGKEDPARWSERLGLTTVARPAGRLVWLHGVSVGESLSLLPLIERIRTEFPGMSVLVTSGTRASAGLLAARLPPDAIHQYAPLDSPAAVRRFLTHWRPEAAIVAESELWPNLILEARERGVRLALVSARLSARSLDGWRRVPGAARAVLGAFDVILARDAAAAGRLASLGVRVDGLADLKFGAPPLPVDETALTRARAGLDGRPVLLGASTHPGEEELLLEAFKAVPVAVQPLLIVAPRHPTRGEAVERIAGEMGLTSGRRAAGAALGAAPVYIADTVGELGLWYSLARLAVVGGSLTAEGVGGHNPFEPARLGCPFIAGPQTSAWPAYEALEAAGATRRVREEDLAVWFSRAIEGEPALAAMAERASAFVAAGDAAAGEAVERLLGLLAR